MITIPLYVLRGSSSATIKVLCIADANWITKTLRRDFQRRDKYIVWPLKRTKRRMRHSPRYRNPISANIVTGIYRKVFVKLQASCFRKVACKTSALQLRSPEYFIQSREDCNGSLRIVIFLHAIAPYNTLCTKFVVFRWTTML